MLEVVFRRVRPDKVDRLREWLREAERRADEIRQTFAQETMRHEIAYLIETREGPVLVYAMEAEDLEQAAAAYQGSALPIDREHHDVMADVLLPGSATVERLYEFWLDNA
jgi:hypothetical protein